MLSGVVDPGSEASIDGLRVSRLYGKCGCAAHKSRPQVWAIVSRDKPREAAKAGQHIELPCAKDARAGDVAPGSPFNLAAFPISLPSGTGTAAVLNIERCTANVADADLFSNSDFIMAAT